MEETTGMAETIRPEKADRSLEPLPPLREAAMPVRDPHHARYKQARDYGAYCSRFATLDGCADCGHHMVEKLMMCRWWNRTFWGRDIVTPEDLKANEELLKASS